MSKDFIQEYRLTNSCFFFFFNDTATTEIYTLSLHDALPIFLGMVFSPAVVSFFSGANVARTQAVDLNRIIFPYRSEEHTSELQSQSNLVCRLLLEKKKNRDALLLIPYNSLSHPLLTDNVIQL